MLHLALHATLYATLSGIRRGHLPCRRATSTARQAAEAEADGRTVREVTPTPCDTRRDERGRARGAPNGGRGLVKRSDARRSLTAAIVAAEQPAIAGHRLTQNRGRPDTVGELATELREQAV